LILGGFAGLFGENVVVFLRKTRCISFPGGGDGIYHVLKCYKDAYHTSKNEFWDIVLCYYDKRVNDENKMWTVRKKVVNIDSNDFYEKIITYMNHIGANL